MRLASALLLAAAAARGALADCVMRQDCSLATPGCVPHATTPAERTPFPLNSSGFVACPQYAGSGCCTPLASDQLFLSFVLAEATLGAASAGGCPACVANIEALWCAFACSPQQSDFVTVLGLRNVTNNVTDQPETVLAVSLAVDAAYANATFNSCSGTGTVRSTPALQSVAGFFDFMGGTQGVQTGHTLVEFDYSGRHPLRAAPALHGRAAAAGGGVEEAQAAEAGTAAGEQGGGDALAADSLPRSLAAEPAGASLGANITPLALAAYNCCSFPANVSTPGAPGNTSCPCASCLGMCPGGGCVMVEPLP